ncbi:MAG: hypothetical protein CVV24_07675 [Ignavibacteriae bacterium HGW-Ignavibacteriae-3]|nr:MAG: hypothetical protein CVV24_07675 [Ignavibacteriae bacterium HGW-Ignavibacteriae-3]
MELIPILSLIILVATISTFILAVGAYILYKVRERKGITADAVQPAALPAELVTPAPLMPDYAQQEQARGPELRPTFVGSAVPPTYGDRYQRPTAESARSFEADQNAPKKKFMRYTNEGYVDPSQQDRKQEDNLRWR